MSSYGPSAMVNQRGAAMGAILKALKVKRVTLVVAGSTVEVVIAVVVVMVVVVRIAIEAAAAVAIKALVEVSIVVIRASSFTRLGNIYIILCAKLIYKMSKK